MSSMLAQLSSLTRAVTSWNADAIAVYGKAEGVKWVATPANEQGFEGVACIDDAARAVHLYSTMIQRGAPDSVRRAATRLLRFVRLMRGTDGRFNNFLFDWEATVNRDGPTSYAGGPYWTARAALALVDGYVNLGIGDCKELALEAIQSASAGNIADRLDAMATLVQAVVLLARSTGDAALALLAHTYAECIADCRLGDALLDEAGATQVHLWAHEQEIALVRAGRLLGRPSLVQVAARSAEVVLRPSAEDGFRRPSTCPYEVSCVARGLLEVGSESGQGHLVAAAHLARAWFFGRNPAGAPLYDPMRGAFLDGIDDGRVNPDSGAESNVEGALCLVTVP
jgi:hypothetical protein